MNWIIGQNYANCDSTCLKGINPNVFETILFCVNRNVSLYVVHRLLILRLHRVFFRKLGHQYNINDSVK